MLKIYHNTKCRKSRAGLSFMLEKGADPRVIDYIRNPFTADELKNLLSKLGLKPFDLVRTQEELYKTHLKGKNLSDEEWKEILIANPRLIKRPIVETESKAVIGDPVENIEEVI